MSTIEKAVERLERKQAAVEKASALVVPEPDTVEKVAPARREVPAVDDADSSLQFEPPQKKPDAPQQHGKVAASIRAKVKPEQGSLGRPVLKLPFELLANKGMVTPIAPRSRVAEEFRAIKRPLLRNIDGATASSVPNANLIMVTSALQGDGKTFTAVNLAISIAMEQDKTVLFVDADVVKGSAGQLLGVPDNSLGLIDLLEDKGTTPADVIMRTNIDNLRILPTGAVNERSTELLASQSMHQLMLELSNRYPDRVIVFDSPPLLMTSEASVLASFMGQIVFVVSTDQTPSDAVTEALEHIGGDKIIGMVLNKAHSRRSNLFGLGTRYGYGYGYGYGSGYGEDSKRQTGDGVKVN